MIFIQRAVYNILISELLTHEFKHDETNKAWWTGRWYGRNLGVRVMSPAREFVVKIIELPVEFGLLDWTGSALHASATYLDPLR